MHFQYLTTKQNRQQNFDQPNLQVAQQTLISYLLLLLLYCYYYLLFCYCYFISLLFFIPERKK